MIAGYHHRRRHHHGIAGYDEIIGDDFDVGADDIASLMAAAGAAMLHRPMRTHIAVPSSCVAAAAHRALPPPDSSPAVPGVPPASPPPKPTLAARGSVASGAPRFAGSPSGSGDRQDFRNATGKIFRNPQSRLIHDDASALRGTPHAVRAHLLLVPAWPT
jgi:hypothetical protein